MIKKEKHFSQYVFSMKKAMVLEGNKHIG